MERHSAAPVLIVSLNNGSKIEIPNLDPQVVQAIFTIHAQILEQEHTPHIHRNVPSPAEPSNQNPVATTENPISLNIPFFPGIANVDNLGVFMQHNQEQADSPDLPKELMDKITSLSKAIGLQDAANMPKAEPHCNCYFCQIARAMHGENITIQEAKNTLIEEEEITEEDLKFRTWDIEQTADRLYLVSNPIDTKEYYSVFLGEPIGCTCGEKNCEHIRAVLSS